MKIPRGLLFGEGRGIRGMPGREVINMADVFGIKGEVGLITNEKTEQKGLGGDLVPSWICISGILGL